MSKRRTWEATNTRIKAVDRNSNDTLELPVDTLEVKPMPYVPEGGTVLELYDDRKVYRNPTYGYKMMLQYDHERSGADFTSGLGTIQELISMYNKGKSLDFHVRYDYMSGSYVTGYDFDGTTFSNGFKCLDMIPDITEETAQVIFEKQARQKPRKLELVSTKVNYTYAEISWIFE